jgi:hypothetical protein
VAEKANSYLFWPATSIRACLFQEEPKTPNPLDIPDAEVELQAVKKDQSEEQ